MNKTNKKHPLKQITIIIKQYDKDPSRNGDEVEIVIMSNGKKITILELYELMSKGLANITVRLDNVETKVDKLETKVDDGFKNVNKRIEHLVKKNRLVE